MSASFNDTKRKLERHLRFQFHRDAAKKASIKPVVTSIPYTPYAWVYRDKKLLQALLDSNIVTCRKRELPRSKSWPSLKAE
jgi:hypothetical protein